MSTAKSTDLFALTSRICKSIPRLTKSELLMVGSVMYLGLCAFFWGLNGDSPICTENDELWFAQPALQILISHDPNPHTFINPASTLIYPLVAYYATLEQFTGNRFIDRTQPPWLLCTQNIEVMIKWPRLANGFFYLFSIPLLYLAGRNWIGKVAALLGVLFYVIAPMVVYYSQILRADTIANFFFCLGILLMGLACDNPTNKRLAIALGICAGLATSTRFFCVALLAPIIVLYGISLFDRQELTHRKAVMVSLAICLSTWLISFFCSSPFVFLDWQQVKTDLAFEVASEFSGIAGLGTIGNLQFYLTMALPLTFGRMLMGAAGTGLLFSFRQLSKKTIVNILLLVAIVVGTCLNPRHWDRWTIPMLPILCLLAGYGIASTYEIILRLFRRSMSENLARRFSLTLASVFTVCAVFFPFRNMLCLEKQKGEFSGRAKAFYFIKEHVPKGSKIVCDMSWDWPDRDDYVVLENVWRPDFVPPRPHNYYLPDDLAKQGYQFMIVQRWNREDYSILEPKKYPREAKFYINLRKHAPMMFTSYVKPRPKILGEQVEERFTPIEVYDLRPLAEGKYPAKDYAPQDQY